MYINIPGHITKIKKTLAALYINLCKSNKENVNGKDIQ